MILNQKRYSHISSVDTQKFPTQSLVSNSLHQIVVEGSE
jgi:hypothetical protein